MSEIQMNIWNRNFNLEVYFKKYQGKEVTELQQKSYECFVNEDDAINQSLKKLITFIEGEYKDKLQEKRIENIFKYVIPKTIYIPNNSKKRMVTLLCNFKFEEEHGLALVFENEKLTNIVFQDDIL